MDFFSASAVGGQATDVIAGYHYQARRGRESALLQTAMIQCIEIQGSLQENDRFASGSEIADAIEDLLKITQGKLSGLLTQCDPHEPTRLHAIMQHMLLTSSKRQEGHVQGCRLVINPSPDPLDWDR